MAEHRHMLGMRGLIDCSRLPIDRQPPTIEYLTKLAAALDPLMRAAKRTRCAILVAHRPWVWRARLFESITSGSGIAFRAFQTMQEAMAWLHEDDSALAPGADLPAAASQGGPLDRSRIDAERRNLRTSSDSGRSTSSTR